MELQSLMGNREVRDRRQRRSGGSWCSSSMWRRASSAESHL